MGPVQDKHRPLQVTSAPVGLPGSSLVRRSPWSSRAGGRARPGGSTGATAGSLRARCAYLAHHDPSRRDGRQIAGTTGRKEHAVRADIVPGGTFPDYELTDHTKKRRRLSELQGNDPMALILARGHYCPKDQQQHLQLAAFQSQIAVAYTRVVTITTDNISTTREFRASVGATWTFLSDFRRKVQKDLDIQEFTDPYHKPMLPHTLVLKPGLLIPSIYNGYWYWGRPSVEELRRDLREVSRELRPDWDTSAPGFREAWEAGAPPNSYAAKALDPSLRVGSWPFLPTLRGFTS